MWNLFQTSLAAIVGAYIYIKPPLQPSESPHGSRLLWWSDKNGSCSSGLDLSQPSCWQPGRYHWQASDQTSQNGRVTPKSNHFLWVCPLVTSWLQRGRAWLVESCKRSMCYPHIRQRQDDERDHFPWLLLLKGSQFPESLKVSSLLPSFLSSFRSKVQRVLFICQAFQLPTHCSTYTASVGGPKEPAFIWNWAQWTGHTWTHLTAISVCS